MTRRLPVVLLTAALVVSACSSDKKEKADPEASKGSSEKLVQVSPLTGEVMRSRPANPVFVVKIENTEGGAPQLGLDKADMVVEELVEGGLTRLAAFFYSDLPSTVGHVRSMRASDIGIAKPVDGQIVASGGSAGTVKKVKKAGITVWSEDFGAPGFSSDPNKVRPYNRLMDLPRLDRRAKVTDIPGPYLTFTKAGAKAEATSSAGAEATEKSVRKATTAAVRFSPSTTTQWKYSGSTYKRTNGHAEKEYGADTVVVLYCDIGDAGYLDPAGNPVPETKLKGNGDALILSGGKATTVTWHKRGSGATISFKAEDGSPVTIDPGHVWLELIPKDGGSVTVQ
ncbi:hypothetical protein ASD11_02940 [Aeromicrobium sp. Root495]|uniref:DUF3048 domain-containing protein n=1 Tax=Aeromicrobium sp. Root495 TaxID=1736550 RepID=UPI0006F3C0D1|nr:DUF3048 domain-containing protein [Aeromicrobium sp. Root495]KQY58627.1 hypothetical protein ASD11_02940 [Aeromicrobium sp. Root495]